MAALIERRDLALENLALRQQLDVFKRRNRVPRLKRGDRVFWLVLSRIWALGDRPCLWFTVTRSSVGSERASESIGPGFRSGKVGVGHKRVGRSKLYLIKRMATANPYWGAPRVHGEPLTLGIEISERTVSRLMPTYRKPSSQTWKAFLNNHVQDLVSVDFSAVPTVSFRVLFVFVVLAPHRRRVVH